MDEIGIPLPQVTLTATEEIELAQRIEAGVIAASIRAGTAFGELRSQATVTELIMIERRGRAAWSRFVECNLRLVAMVSKKESVRSGMGEAELFQEGCLGLIEAVRRFDHRRELRFATYALYWIRSYVAALSANRGGELNLPASRAERVRGVRGAEAQLSQQLGRHASAAEVAQAVGRSAGWVAGLLGYRHTWYLDTEELADLELVDPVATEDLEAVLGSRLPGRELLAGLKQSQREVIELRYGFVDGSQHSFSETSRMLGRPTSTIRREEARALDQLRGICPQQAIVHLAS
jgi:RNA polymerase primary sigma factor